MIDVLLETRARHRPAAPLSQSRPRSLADAYRVQALNVDGGFSKS